MGDADLRDQPWSDRRDDGGARRSAWPVVVWRVVASLVIAVNTVVMWSDGVAAWWFDRSGDDDGWSVPVVGWVLALRPDVGDADLHAAAWAAATFVVVMAVRRGAWTAWSIAAVWAWSVVVESLQPVVSDTRRFEVVDLVGNSGGVASGAALALWWRARTR